MEGEDYDDIGFEFEGLEGADKLFESFVQREVLDKAAGVLGKASSARRRVHASLVAPPFLRAVDKLSFCLGVLYLMATEGLLLAAPHALHRWYVWTIVPLLLLRFRSYHAAKFHYFMLDFCYFAQAMLLFSLALYPRSRILFQLVFCFANGPLAWGIVAWNNSLVFHDLDKMTSCAIHIMPAIVTFGLRWYPEAGLSGVCATEACEISLMEAVVHPICFYIFWQVTYIAKTEFIDKAKLASDAELVTSLRWMTERRPHPIYRAVERHQYRFRFGPFLIRHPSSLLMLVQLIYTVLTMLPIKFMYESFAVHASMLVFFMLVCIWNGANYYFDVFSKNYTKRVEQLMKEAGLQQAPKAA